MRRAATARGADAEFLIMVEFRPGEWGMVRTGQQIDGGRRKRDPVQTVNICRFGGTGTTGLGLGRQSRTGAAERLFDGDGAIASAVHTTGLGQLCTALTLSR